MKKLCTVSPKYVLFKQNIILPNMLIQVSRMKEKWFISKLLCEKLSANSVGKMKGALIVALGGFVAI